MKKNIKKISVLIVIIISLILFLPSNILALSKELSFATINNTEKIEVGDLSFSDISFKDYSLESVKAFGLSGKVVNTSKNTINYRSEIYYYDANYNIIAEGYSLGMAVSGTSDYNQMSNLSILNGHSISEIHYYSLSIQILDNETIVKPSKNEAYASYDYVIDKYDINIVVNENNTFDITEKITAYFNTRKHGIIRTIPLRNEITRLDGSKSSNRTQITNLNVSDEYLITRQNGNYGIKIGSEDHTLIGEKEYTISYTYNLGKDPMKNYDEIYYNIIGNNWDTVIGNITFTVTMPKEFDSSKLGFSYGPVGSTDNSNIKYNVSGNTITGSYEGILNANEALTIRCELPEGYFVGAGLASNMMNYVLLLMPLVFLGIAILLWYKFGRDDIIVETVEFYPPEGYDSLEVGFLYKGRATYTDVTSLLVYLANKGYIKITETEEKSLFTKVKGFKITKLKEYDGNNPNEEVFLKGLFTKRPTISFGSLFSKNTEPENANTDNEVTLDDLYNNFYITMNRIILAVNTKKNKNKIFEKSASSKSKFITLMIIATYCLITIPPILIYGEPSTLIFALLFPGIGFTVLFKFVFGDPELLNYNHSSIGLKIFGLVWGIGFGGIPWAMLVLPALKQDIVYLIGYIIGLACVLGMEICLKYLPKRTPYGNEILGKLRGFKNFLETAEKDKLETMVMQNPTYFYDILPYTYVLGVSDKWIKKFESISLQAPSWYEGTDTFDIVSFGSFINSAMSSAESAMSSNPSSESGGSSGGSSGGGSSGGGSGGGGGSSW